MQEFAFEVKAVEVAGDRIVVRPLILAVFDDVVVDLEFHVTGSVSGNRAPCKPFFRINSEMGGRFLAYHRQSRWGRGCNPIMRFLT